MSIYKGDKLVAGRTYEETTTIPITLNSNFKGTATLVKKGSNVTITLYSVTAVSATGSTLIATLPEGIKPTSDCYSTLWGDNDTARILAISDDGKLYASGTGLSQWFKDGIPLHMWGTASCIAQ